MKRGFVILILWTGILLSLLLFPIAETQIPSPWGFKHFDKVAHFGLFFVTGLVSVFSIRFFSQFRTRMLFGIVFGLFLAISTEFAQSLIPLRNMSFYDLFADIAGLGVALALCAFIHR
ncbi:VanZ family protein [Chloroflexota bacterium]